MVVNEPLGNDQQIMTWLMIIRKHDCLLIINNYDMFNDYNNGYETVHDGH